MTGVPYYEADFPVMYVKAQDGMRSIPVEDVFLPAGDADEP